MVSRIYVEKKPGFDVEAQQLLAELANVVPEGLAPDARLRIVNRYDVEGLSDELFERCVPVVFSEPQVDATYRELPARQGEKDVRVFAVEALPGQFDQRADSAAECVQLISQGERPTVRCAKVYVIEGGCTDEALAAIKHYVINPVEAREASLEERATLRQSYPEPADVEVLDGFLELDKEQLQAMIDRLGLAMDLADIIFCQEYFAGEGRVPTITEIRMIDTYWSDHCRHTTFGTVLEHLQFDDKVVAAAFDRYLEMRARLGRDDRPVTLMDMGARSATPPR